jgi:hypothetical protein
VMKKEKSSNELNDGSNLDSSAKTPEWQSVKNKKK